MEQLIEIQNKLKVPKGNLNKFGNYKYRSAEDILESVKPILKEFKAVLILSDEIVQVGSKVFLKATAKLAIGDKSVTTYGFAETSEHKGMSAEQTTGTASSYARKYALNGLFLIDETESDADSKEPKTEIVKQKTTASNNYTASDIEFTEGFLSGAKTVEDLQTKYLSLTVEMRKLTSKFVTDLKTKLTPKTQTA